MDSSENSNVKRISLNFSMALESVVRRYSLIASNILPTQGHYDKYYPERSGAFKEALESYRQRNLPVYASGHLIRLIKEEGYQSDDLKERMIPKLQCATLFFVAAGGVISGTEARWAKAVNDPMIDGLIRIAEKRQQPSP